MFELASELVWIYFTCVTMKLRYVNLHYQTEKTIIHRGRCEESREIVQHFLVQIKQRRRHARHWKERIAFSSWGQKVWCALLRARHPVGGDMLSTAITERVQYLESKYHMLSRAVPKHFEEEKDELKVKLARAGKLALTTNCWTALKNDATSQPPVTSRRRWWWIFFIPVVDTRE